MTSKEKQTLLEKTAQLLSELDRDDLAERLRDIRDEQMAPVHP